MRNHVLRLSVLIVLVFAAGAAAQAPPPPVGDARFTGRWELVMQPPSGVPEGTEARAFALLEMTSAGGALSGSFINTPLSSGKVSSVSVKGDELTLVLQLEVMGQTRTLTLTGKRVADRLELSGTAEGVPTPRTVVAIRTTKDTLTLPGTAPGTGASPGAASRMPQLTPDREAFNAAMAKPREQRPEALRKFLVDFPDSAVRRTATMMLANNLDSAGEKAAVLQQYIKEFPESAEEGYLQLAVVSPDKEARIAGLRQFLADRPNSPLKARAESALKRLTAPPGDTTESSPIRVGGNIVPPRKIVDVKPVYPADAQQARAQGVVIIEATIDLDGNVTNARILRSIPLLDQAALDAVNQWKFTPTELDGAPVRVIMTVTVNFTLQ